MRPLEAALAQAERTGLRIALAGRTVVLAAFAAWHITQIDDFPSSVHVTQGLAASIALGLACLTVIGTRFDRPWIKYALFAFDIVALGVVFATVSLGGSETAPQVLVFRAYGIYYFSVFLGMAALTLSPRLLLFAGATIIATWWGLFAYIVSGMPSTVSWGAMVDPGLGYVELILHPDFIGAGNRVEESLSVAALTGLLAFAAHRARVVVVRWQEAERDRDAVSRLFGEFVPAEVLASAAGGEVASVRREASALALDVAGFTTLSERREPARIVALLDELFDYCTEVVARHGGVVTNLQGDALIAAFNVPALLDGHQRAAVAAAIEIVDGVAGRRFDGEQVGVRIGVHCGEVSAGVVGGSRRRVYTIHGDAVNVAARLEQANKQFGSRLLVSETVLPADLATTRFEFAADLTPRGRKDSLRTFMLREPERPRQALAPATTPASLKRER